MSSAQVIEWHLEKYIDNSDEMVAYFYCSKKTTDGKGTSRETVLRSFVRQISWSTEARGIETLILNEYNSRGSHRYLSFSRAKCFLPKLIEKYK